MGSRAIVELPTIDFTEFDPENPGGPDWEAARDQVMDALERFGAFEAIYDSRVTPEVREALFGKAVDDLFGLPLEAKLGITFKNKPQLAYICPSLIPSVTYEMISIEDAANYEDTESFTRRLWPDGNPSFRDAVLATAKQLTELDHMARRMVMESLGIAKYYDSSKKQIESGLRLTEYEPAADGGERISMDVHTDSNLFSLVCQHQIQGLEVMSNDGNYCALPSLNSVTVMVGDSISAWTNGRLEPCHHRVVFRGSEKRHVAHFGVYHKDEFLVKAADELVDEKHPLQYKPYVYGEYYRFRLSASGRKAQAPLKAFCGVEQNEVEV